MNTKQNSFIIVIFFTIDDILTNNFLDKKKQKLLITPRYDIWRDRHRKDLIAQAIHNHSFRKHNPL